MPDSKSKDESSNPNHRHSNSLLKRLSQTFVGSVANSLNSQTGDKPLGTHSTNQSISSSTAALGRAASGSLAQDKPETHGGASMDNLGTTAERKKPSALDRLRKLKRERVEQSASSNIEAESPATTAMSPNSTSPAEATESKYVASASTIVASDHRVATLANAVASGPSTSSSAGPAKDSGVGSSPATVTRVDNRSTPSKSTKTEHALVSRIRKNNANTSSKSTPSVPDVLHPASLFDASRVLWTLAPATRHKPPPAIAFTRLQSDIPVSPAHPSPGSNEPRKGSVKIDPPMMRLSSQDTLRPRVSVAAGRTSKHGARTATSTDWDARGSIFLSSLPARLPCFPASSLSNHREPNRLPTTHAPISPSSPGLTKLNLVYDSIVYYNSSCS